jgi:hypothetical protein
MFIGDLRRRLFLDVDHEWNGVVRDITAQCETEGMEVNPEIVNMELADFYRKRASLALFRLNLQETVH